MKSKNKILLFITIVIFATIGLQIYWNIKNYKNQKQQLVREVQATLDTSYEHYYLEESKKNYVTFIGDSDIDTFMKQVKEDSLFKNFKKSKNKDHIKLENTTFETDTSTEIRIERGESKQNNKIKSDKEKKVSLVKVQFNDSLHITKKKQISLKKMKYFKGVKSQDSLFVEKNYANKIFISIKKDSINTKALNAVFDSELKRKNIAIKYAYTYKKENNFQQTFGNVKDKSLTLSTISKTNYLKKTDSLLIHFSNPILLVLKRSLVEILLSFLLSLSVVFCLLYLLKIINKQKKIDEIKNDLISNITHEFKTPITTISTAIEGIKAFNDKNDTEKTNRYLDISDSQLKKLQVMVEKLLETATLEKDELKLHNEKVDLVKLISNLVERFKLTETEKNIEFCSDVKELNYYLDEFHFENTISNCIDNAIKYGGNEIKISIFKSDKNTFIAIEDNGNPIDKKEQTKIFDKFYRVPNGNIHNVKGFGIGLYYSKKIIEKMNGKLELICNKSTLFKITLPNE